ncbi:MAG TPA: S41 family peptidase [Thermoanaerobaculia bacterium]|jgi:C-terminal processing protease CtpA/Prc|nr:S41 family peptidase [Thermoanaerobaculia bacterium]
MRKFAALLAIFFTAASAQALTDRQLDNLEAFTRLMALVRFFHPSDAVAAADWNRVAVAGVSSVRDSGDLARGLEDFFRPLAPTLRVRPTGERPETPAELRPPSGDARIVAWRHYGGHFDSDLKLFSSERIDDRNPPGYGTLAQAVLVPDSLKGKRVRLRAWIRAEMVGDGRVQLGLRVDRAGGKPGFFDNMADRPLRSTPWKPVDIEGDVAPDAERILVMLVMTGGGKVWIDEVSLAAVGGGGGSILLNPGFDDGEPGAQPPGWLFPYESVRAGYHLVLRRVSQCQEGNCPGIASDPRRSVGPYVYSCRAGSCAEISSDPIATPRFVQPAQVLEADLGSGVTAWLPVTLHADAEGTLPHTPAPALDVDTQADTPEAWMAAVALAWGIFQHLHPELSPDDPAWRAALRPALATADSRDREAFLRSMRALLAPLHDSRANIVPPKGGLYGALPLAWEVAEGRLVVTGVVEGTQGIRPGDVVEALDGRPALEVLAAEEALASAGTPEARQWQALESLLFGPKGSRMTLRLQGGSEIALTRETPYEKLPVGTPLQPVAEPRPGVLYIDLGRIEEEDLEALTPRLAAAKGIVFDLRRGRNVSTVLLSHLIDRTAASSKWQVPVVMAPDHRDVEWMTTFWTIEPKAPRFRGRVAFLADGRSDGYAETLLTMIEAYKMADIVGARSGGSNGPMNRADLPGGWRLTWSGQRVLKHDDSPLQGIGVAPTVPAYRTLRGIAEGRDEVVERALAAVGR